MSKTIYYRTIEIFYINKKGNKCRTKVKHVFTHQEDIKEWTRKIIDADQQLLIKEALGIFYCEDDIFLKFGKIKDIVVDLD